MLWSYGLKSLKLTIKWFFACPLPLPPPPSLHVPMLLYSSKNIKNSYILYSYVLKFTWIHVTFILMFWNVENLNLSEPEKILFGYFFSMYFPCILIKLFYTICRRSLHSRTVFKNLKNKSQCFMKFKNQSAFYNYHALQISIK